VMQVRINQAWPLGLCGEPHGAQQQSESCEKKA